ncbi:MAG TPA: hypothetical protein VEJ41_00990 [Candidatus Acidoferrales bacterium]|nr:hypothetical protein [Candidatus Acidoferrales bacterium]
MDPKVVREHRQRVIDELERIDKARQALLAMLKADDEWIALDASGEPYEPVSKNGKAHADPVYITHEIAALRVLASLRGGSMHTKELWPRMQDRGAISNAKNPVASVDFLMHQLYVDGIVARVAPRTYSITEQGLDYLSAQEQDIKALTESGEVAE